MGIGSTVLSASLPVKNLSRYGWV